MAREENETGSGAAPVAPAKPAAQPAAQPTAQSGVQPGAQPTVPPGSFTTPMPSHDAHPSAEATAKSAAPRRTLSLPAMTKDVQDRLAILAVRAFFFFIAGGLGIAGAEVIAEARGTHWDPFLGLVFGCATGALLILVEVLFSQSPIRMLSAITFGLLMGLAMSLVFQYVVEFIVNAFATYDVQVKNPEGLKKFLSFLHIMTTTIFCYFGVTTLLRTKDDFKFIIPYVEFRRELRGHSPLVLDTSCFVDGRIQSILATGVLDQKLLVPKFVLAELQTVADSADGSLRERGRRGMDILHEIERTHHIELIERPTAPGEPVDSALIALALEMGGKVVTTDFNLQKNARLQGVQVININDLATSLKPAFVPGESMTVRLLREGEDKGQAVGFLRDGTMVVVENARGRIGHEVAVEVTSSLQTNAGKMVFGRLRRRDTASET